MKSFLRLLARGDFATAFYRLGNRLRGVDFSPESVGPEVGAHLQAQANMYVDSGGPELAWVIRQLGPIPPGARILDLGSGKGGSTITLAAFPFHEAIGLELSQSMIEVARRNAAKLKVTNVRFVCADAGTYDDLDHFTHIYFFNSFSGEILQGTLKNLKKSLERTPRPMRLISKHPITHEVVMNSNIFQTHRDLRAPKGPWPYRIYETARAIVLLLHMSFFPLLEV